MLPLLFNVLSGEEEYSASYNVPQKQLHGLLLPLDRQPLVKNDGPPFSEIVPPVRLEVCVFHSFAGLSLIPLFDFLFVFNIMLQFRKI